MTKKFIVTSFSVGFEHIFDEIKEARPDLSNNSEVAKECVRSFWKDLQEKETLKKKVELRSINPPLLNGYVISTETEFYFQSGNQYFYIQKRQVSENLGGFFNILSEDL